MKIWQVCLDKDVAAIKELEDREIADRLYDDLFLGEVINDWKRIDVESYFKGIYPDVAMFFPSNPLFSKKIVNAMSPLIGELVQFLPVNHPEFDYFIFNIINIQDAIDHSRAESSRSEVLDILRLYEKHVFNNKFVESSSQRYIFRIPELRNRIFVSDDFIELYFKNDLQGLNFELVYDSSIEEPNQKYITEQYNNYIAQHINKGQAYPWETAVELLDQHIAFASGHWKIQLTEYGDLAIGQLRKELDYQFFFTGNIPKNLYSLTWYKTERSNL